ncbi:CNVH-domain-containing protein [Aulographum hederae CBS 113979]|uniref:CNVH-domain-containing protein n=1 Tax=Aulographum hederae CBS 113979 TaxID=1176131 RepID=A0A6G1GTZ3_9PEZI|nr:CNVH-domain-containing protein [Aulographum hederae CBS 113979]
MSFSKSSREIALGPKNALTAKCKKTDGTEADSSISLDKFLGNDHGRFSPGRKSFSKSARQITLNGLFLSAQLATPNGEWKADTVNLDAFITNQNGHLVFVPKFDQHSLRPPADKGVKPGFRDIQCSLCEDFPNPKEQGLEINTTELMSSDKKRSDCPSCSILEQAVKDFAPKSFHYPRGVAIIKMSPIKPKKPLEIAIEYMNGDKTETKHCIMQRSLGNQDSSQNFIHVPRATLTIGDSTSQRAFQLAQTWISTCVKSHPKCASRVENHKTTLLPRRILDLGADLSGPVKVLTTNGERGQYACLSHCWGKTKNITLSNGNKEDLSRKVPWKEMPKTYTDAIKFCRKLGIRYLWIDALCIIQDSAEDWLDESGKMGSYYGNCHVTLAATTAPDHDGGCEVYGPPQKYSGTGLDGLPYCVFIRPKTAHIYNQKADHHADRFPLLTRAWVYQERRLSSRVLHFCGEEMFFECTQSIACECDPPKGMQDYDSWTKAREAHYVTHQDLSDLKDEKEKIEHEWHSFVRAYSRLSITFASDRLPALSGLAKLTRERRDSSRIPAGRYLAGLWEGTLINDMTWCVGKNLARWRKVGNSRQTGPNKGDPALRPASNPRPEEYVAPSWSWASVLDAVEYAPFGYDYFLCQVLDAQTELKDSEPTGRVIGGTIVMRGKLQQTRWERTEKQSGEVTFVLPDIQGTRSTLFGWNTKLADPGMKWRPDYNVQAPGKHMLDRDSPLFLFPLARRTVIGKGSGAEFDWKLYPGKAVVETVYLVLRRARSPDMPVFERVGWTEYTGSSDVPNLKAAKEMKFMVV